MKHATGRDADDYVIAAAQFASVADVQANLTKIEELSRRAAKSGADIVVFPEAAMYDWNSSGSEIAAAAHASGDLFTTELLRIATEQHITVIAGAFVTGPGERPLNRLIAASPDGHVVGTYDKVHLYDAFSYRESEKVEAGAVDEGMSELCVVQVGPIKLGLMNCYDLRFPEMARALIDAGANVIAVSSAWVSGPHKEMHWETLLRARAIENTCYVLGSSQPPPASVGLTMIVDPFGLVASTCTENEGIVTSQISLSRLDEVRKIIPSLEHRRYAVVPAQQTP